MGTMPVGETEGESWTIFAFLFAMEGYEAAKDGDPASANPY